MADLCRPKGLWPQGRTIKPCLAQKAVHLLGWPMGLLLGRLACIHTAGLCAWYASSWSIQHFLPTSASGSAAGAMFSRPFLRRWKPRQIDDISFRAIDMLYSPRQLMYYWNDMDLPW